MKYEVVESAHGWIVQCDGLELARFDEQLEALNFVAERLSDPDHADCSYSLAMRYMARA